MLRQEYEANVTKLTDDELLAHMKSVLARSSQAGTRDQARSSPAAKILMAFPAVPLRWRNAICSCFGVCNSEARTSATTNCGIIIQVNWRWREMSRRRSWLHVQQVMGLLLGEVLVDDADPTTEVWLTAGLNKVCRGKRSL